MRVKMEETHDQVFEALHLTFNYRELEFTVVL